MLQVAGLPLGSRWLREFRVPQFRFPREGESDVSIDAEPRILDLWSVSP